MGSLWRVSDHCFFIYGCEFPISAGSFSIQTFASMEGQHCLLLLCALGLAFGEMENDNDIDFVSFLRQFQPGLLVRDEAFLIHEDSEIISGKELRPPEFISVFEQAKDTPARRDTNEPPGPLVVTKDGKIQGVTVDKAHIFHGIPYADPPVGAYRWKPPRAVTPWAEVYDASFPRAACMQACRGPIDAECPRTVRSNSHLFFFSACIFLFQLRYILIVDLFTSALPKWHYNKLPGCRARKTTFIYTVYKLIHIKPLFIVMSLTKGQRGLPLPQHLCPSGHRLQQHFAEPSACHGVDPRWRFHRGVGLQAAVWRTIHQQLHTHYCCKCGVSIRWERFWSMRSLIKCNKIDNCYFWTCPFVQLQQQDQNRKSAILQLNIYWYWIQLVSSVSDYLVIIWTGRVCW